MYLSTQDLEEIAEAALQDFRTVTGIDTVFTPIDQFAKDYLGLNVRIAKLSDDGSLCGLTAYADTIYEMGTHGQTEQVHVKANDVLLDESFVATPEQCRRLCGKRRFTLAHECAHQILFGMELEEQKAKRRQMYSERRMYSLRDLKRREDWNEWQANVLGAAILMPAKSIRMVMAYYFPGRTIHICNGYVDREDRAVVEYLCGVFAVSYSAMLIRLEQLGFCERKNLFANEDAMGVIA